MFDYQVSEICISKTERISALGVAFLTGIMAMSCHRKQHFTSSLVGVNMLLLVHLLAVHWNNTLRSFGFEVVWMFLLAQMMLNVGERLAILLSATNSWFRNCWQQSMGPWCNCTIRIVIFLVPFVSTSGFLFGLESRQIADSDLSFVARKGKVNRPWLMLWDASKFGTTIKPKCLITKCLKSAFQRPKESLL